MRIWRAAVSIGAIAIGVTSCSSADSNAPPASGGGSTEPPDAYPENRGQLLLASEISESIPLRWGSPDEIFYYTVGSATVQRTTQLRGIKVSDRSTRVYHDGGNRNGNNYHAIEVSPDGAHVYFGLTRLVSTGVEAMVLNATSAEPVMIAPISRWSSSHVKHAAAGAPILATPDSKGAAYGVAPDSIRMYDPLTRTSRRVGEGCETPVAFSPDGTRLLCRRNTANAYFIMTVATGAVESISLPAGTLFVHWSEGGLKTVVLGTGSAAAIVDVATGQARPLVRPGDLRSSEAMGLGYIAWSRDGRRIAFATSRFNGFNLPQECVIRVVDADAGSLQRVAVTKRAAQGGLDPFIGAMDFAPDGRSLVYVTGTPTGAEAYIAAVQ